VSILLWRFDDTLLVDGSVAVAEMEEDDQVFDLALEARLHAAETIKQSRQELIVVASLVERIPNLAGLTRTCEVFFFLGDLVYLVGDIKSRLPLPDRSSEQPVWLLPTRAFFRISSSG
jgi:hypothetical protein